MVDQSEGTPIERRIIAPLLERTPPDVREIVVRRLDAMVRHLTYIADQDTEDLASVMPASWSLSQIRVICALNSFYQVVLGPLSSSARDRFPSELIVTVPVTHGSTRFDQQRTRQVRSMMRDFHRIAREAEIPYAAMDARQADDLLRVLRVQANDE